MATKKKSVSRTRTALGAEPDMAARPKTKPALTQATDTVKAIRALIESTPVVAPVATASPVGMSAAVVRIIDGPIQNTVAKVFEASPDKEFTVNAVIAALKGTEPGIRENSIRFTITELKRKSIIHLVRTEGHHQILKFTKAGEAKPFPKSALVIKPTTKTALKAVPADVASDLAVLRETTLVIAKLETLVQRNHDIFTQIQKLRSVL